MTEPVVSVVFRAFNCEKYVGQAIESILVQTLQDFEVVVVNDASMDGTEAILRAYAQRDRRIRVFRNETHQGAVKTMNIVLRHARGEFIAVHDADDVSLPHRLETQVNFLRANPQIALVGGGAYIIDGEGEVIQVVTHKCAGPEEVRQYLEEGNCFRHTSVMYRRKCIEAIGLYDEFFTSSHDYDMVIRMADMFDVFCHEEPLVQFRRLNSGITGRQKRTQVAFAELARRRRKAKKEGVSLDLQKEYNRLVARKAIWRGLKRNRPLSDARYYYNVGLLLLERGEPQKARRRFRQALKCRTDIHACLGVLVFYMLSFWPKSINSTPAHVLRQVL